MKRILMMTAAALALGTAGAQTFQGNLGNYALTGCALIPQGVRCDFNYTVQADMRVYFASSLFQAITPAGITVDATGVALADGKWNTVTDTRFMFINTPVKVSVLFPTTALAGGTSLRVLLVEGKREDRVPVAALAPAIRPVTTPALNTSAYNAALTDCKAGANGALICTATLTPQR